MNFIHGQTIKLTKKTQSGTDPFGVPTYTTQEEDVDNVLISPTSDAEIVNEIQLYGKASVYTLCIPKGDAHVWTDTIITFFGNDWRTIGPVVEYQEELIPGPWNKKIKVALYE